MFARAPQREMKARARPLQALLMAELNAFVNKLAVGLQLFPPEEEGAAAAHHVALSLLPASPAGSHK